MRSGRHSRLDAAALCRPRRTAPQSTASPFRRENSSPPATLLVGGRRRRRKRRRAEGGLRATSAVVRRQGGHVARPGRRRCDERRRDGVVQARRAPLHRRSLRRPERRPSITDTQLTRPVTGQLEDTPTRGLPTRELDISRTGQVADWKTHGLARCHQKNENKLSMQSRR